ncbi:SufE family protein [Gulosibacter molinativorax]|uniref:SufE family protein n=1 Tax=Gulosibacter molinativorax TaxID=256821 RepID=A0ABT7C5J5_9MICO|nr:SufE family protein [Gulosibacter molinativorax]MDJ1370466.1 SufE family protein [Gulosibacter molinativorax]QUY61380.1 Putative thiosulfate sulfurtransferase domain protein [Gulosibacter molinativorax]
MSALPQQLAEIREDFLAVPDADKLTLLLEFSDELPEVPEQYADVEFEQVIECQSPVFITTEVSDDGRVQMFAKAPAEAPTTRGFASILVQGLSGLTTEEILDVPADFPFDLGITKQVSPLRLRGMVGMLGRVKRQVKEHLDRQASQ